MSYGLGEKTVEFKTFTDEQIYPIARLFIAPGLSAKSNPYGRHFNVYWGSFIYRSFLKVARIRYLKPEFFIDEDLKNLPFEARLFYCGLWCHADKEGRLEDRPERLKVQILPYDNIDPEKMLNLLCNRKSTGKPFIQRYAVDGNNYIQILQWEKHQNPHHTEKNSVIPEQKSPPNNPPKEKEKEKEKEKCSSSILPLSNCSITVKQPLKLQYLEFVMLTEDEYKKLCEKFGKSKTDKCIENLNNYIGSKGKRYKSHYHTILQWEAKDERNKEYGKGDTRTDRQKELDSLGTEA